MECRKAATRQIVLSLDRQSQYERRNFACYCCFPIIFFTYKSHNTNFSKFSRTSIEMVAAAAKTLHERMRGDDSHSNKSTAHTLQRITTTTKCVKLSRLQKIVWSLAGSVRLNLPRCWIKLQEVLFHILPNFQYGRHVTATITVVGCTKYCDNIFILQEEITKLIKKMDIFYYQIRMNYSQLERNAI